MATPPQMTSLNVESMSGLTKEQKALFETLAKTLNPYLNDSVNALDRNLTFGENFKGQLRTFEFTTPVASSDFRYALSYRRPATGVIVVPNGNSTLMFSDAEGPTSPDVSTPGTAWTWTCPVSAYYNLAINLHVYSTVTYTSGAIVPGWTRNGTEVIRFDRTDDGIVAGHVKGMAGSITVYCNAGEVWRPTIIQTTGNTGNVGIEQHVMSRVSVHAVGSADAPSGIPAPFNVTLPNFPGTPHLSLILRAEDVTNANSPVPVAGVSFAFRAGSQDGQPSITVTDVKGCSPLRRYRVTALFLPK